MKDFVHINSMMDHLKLKGVTTWFDRLNFKVIFALWTAIVFLFGLIYGFAQTQNSFLMDSMTAERVTSLADCIYFSFITATTTGFGDILPQGYFKIISVFEVIFGMLLLALVTSKLVSIKQDAILTEIYEISFKDRVNRLRSSLFLFRQNINRLINKSKERAISVKHLQDIYMYLSSFEEVLDELIFLSQRSSKHQYFYKEMDGLGTELMLNSINASFGKLLQLIHRFQKINVKWKNEVTIDLINSSIKKSERVFASLQSRRNLLKKTEIDLSKQRQVLVDAIAEIIKTE